MEPRNIIGPLFFNPVLEEVYIQLPHPHQNIRITPPRPSDVHRIIPILNDIRVYSFLKGPPFPYTDDDATSFVTTRKASCDDVLKEISERGDSKPGTFFSGCPVRSIREVLPDGSDVYIGDIDLGRSRFIEEPDKRKRGELESENGAKAVGDASIVWCPGDYLAPSHHGRGIMPATTRALINTWAVPYMNARRWIATTFSDNVASQRVFIKLGFTQTYTVPDIIDLSAKGRGIKGLTVFEYVSPDGEEEATKNSFISGAASSAVSSTK